MTEKHIAEYFQKSITTPNSFLTDIWSDTVFDNLLVINDFVKHKSNISSNLSVEEIKRICRTNAKRSRKKLSNNKNDEIQRRYSIIINQENIGENVLKIHPIATVPMFNSTWTPEELITDDLLDSFNIPLGKKIQRLNMFYQNSEILYNYLCYYIGSERNVKCRRWFSRKKCFKTRLNVITMEASGSQAEGLDMKESDTDIMVILDTYGSVPENTAQSTSYRGPTRIQYTSSTQSPGYVCVELVIGSECVPIPNFILQELMNKQLLGWNFIGRITTHGPALAHLPFRYEMDIVPALKSKTWPKIANEWILRERKFGWPSQEMIYNIVKQGCFIVPVGSKINQSNQSEWRLSFNLAEKDLIFSFNHTQLLVYGLLKLVLNEIENRKKKFQNYFVLIF